jgi:undecaprenyl-phosphate 4-deoxy-4-formamido-L-arabinose transferase
MTKQDSLFRRIGSRFNDKIANIVIRKPADLYLSSFKIVNKFIINEVIKFDGPDPYIDGIILRSTTRIGTVQVEHHSRQSGQSGYTLSKLVSLWASMILNFSIIPLRITGLFGFVLCTNTLVYVVHKTFFEKPYGNLTEHQTEMSVMMFLFGILFLGIGLISEYIGKIHLLLYKNPQFIVRRMITRSDT